MTRSRAVYAIEVIDAAPRLTDNGRELLLSACQMLQSLLGQEDKALIQSDKVEVWIAEAAALFGKSTIQRCPAYEAADMFTRIPQVVVWQLYSLCPLITSYLDPSPCTYKSCKNFCT